MPYRREALHRSWRQINTAVEERLLSGTEAGGPDPLLARFHALCGEGADAFRHFARAAQTRFESSLLAGLHNPHRTGDIPPFTHRIWLTAPDAPVAPPATYLANALHSSRGLATAALHFFWTNSDDVAREVEARAKEVGLGNLCVRMLATLAPHPVLAQVERLVTAHRHALAAEVVKFLVLDRLGGIVADLGVVFNETAFDLLRLSDYGLVVAGGERFETACLAAAPDADLVRLMLAAIARPGVFDARYAIGEGAFTGRDEERMFGGSGFTVLAMLFLPEGARLLLLPANSEWLRWHRLGASQGRFGNVPAAAARPTLAAPADLSAADQLAADHLRLFGAAPALALRIRTLLAAQPVFEAAPTRFCRIFYFNGSDKALAWHNYGYAYNFLLGRMVGGVRRILEIGIGTNHLAVPSTMGASGVPGASLRAWRECFPGAAVVGADVDRRILFDEPGIATFWVDQTSPEAVARLFEQAGGEAFDLIIDDGLHTFDANRILLEGAYRHLRAGGLYVIEDVDKGALPAWERYFATAGLAAALVSLPSATNERDNRLILIPGGQARG